MKQLFLTGLLAGSLFVGSIRQLAAQVLPGGYWFEVSKGTLLLKSAKFSRAVDRLVALPNGTSLDYRRNSVILANGRRIKLRNGDQVSLQGEITHNDTSADNAAELAAQPDATPDPRPALAAAPPTVATPKPDAAPPVATPKTDAVPMAATAVVALLPAAPAAPRSAFTYVAPVPVGGKLKGVVELGASGFNLFVVRIDPQRNWQLEKAEFGASLVMENMTNSVEVRQVLKLYIRKMLDFGVAGQDIHFVVSSGAAKAAIMPRIVASLRVLGYVVNVVTPEREGALALKAVLPASYADRAFVVDMGSANTKVSWLAGGRSNVREGYGAKYYQLPVTDAVATADLKAKTQQVPAARRSTCFILGGAPYEMARKLRQGKERYVVLQAPAAYQPESAKDKAGLALYQAVTEATGCQQFVFDFDSNFTIGYLLAIQQ